MNRIEYMQRLEELLADIPAEEREDAINYYNDYFDAGGEDNEEETITALGSPEQLAATIKLANTEGEVIDGEFTETGYIDNLGRGANELDKYSQINVSGGERVKKKKDPATIILIIILTIFALPILLPLGFAFLMVVISFAIAAIAIVFSLAAAFVAVGIAALISGIVGICVAIGALVSNPYGALLLMGISLMLTAFGLVFALGCINLVVKLVPPVIRGIVRAVCNLFAWIKKKLQRRES